MALPGIPIPETQCIGDSLFSINNALTALDTAVAAAAGASVTVSDTPPSGASPGDLWFDSSSGITSVFYDSTWIDVGGGDSGTSAGSVNGIVKADGAGNFSAAVAGTDYLTSATLGSSPAAAKAWVTFDGSTTPPNVLKSYKVPTVARVSSGRYTINFETGTMTSNDYCAVGMSNLPEVDASFDSSGALDKTQSSCKIVTSSGGAGNTSLVCVVFYE
jgi:hypothetical protein